MGEVISMEERRARRGTTVAEVPSFVSEVAAGASAAGPLAQVHEHRGSSPQRLVTFYFDPVAPEAYLAAERVDRLGSAVAWVPVAPLVATRRVSEEARRRAVAARAAQLRLPLVWPDPTPGSVRATRVASLAAEVGSLPAFALAAGRLVFCGGYDLDDPEILAEAAAAAGLGMDASMRAAADTDRDAAPLEIAARLVGRGADRLPCFEVGSTLFCGEERLPEAVAASRTAGKRPQRFG